MKLDGATFLLQWAAGGLMFGWVTTRRREVSLGYGWLIRITFGVMALGAFGLFMANDHPDAAIASLLCAGAAGVALAVSVQRHAARARPGGVARRSKGACRGDDRQNR